MKNKTKKSLFKTITKQWWLKDDEDSINYKILKALTETCSYLPKTIRKKIYSIIGYIVIWVSRFFFVLSHVSFKGYIFTGKEKHSGKNLNLLFIGSNYPSTYIMNLIYVKKPKIEREFTINILNKGKILNELQSDIDAVFIKCDRFYSDFLEKQGFTIIPEWVRMTIDISNPLDEFYSNLSKSAKEDIRKIKKLDYTYEISEDINKLDFFYHKMYAPYASWRFSETAIFTNYYTMKILLELGSKILFIKHKGEYIFGGLFLKDKNKITASYAGLRKGKFDHIKRGVIAASYYYLINYSKEHGATFVDLGSCRSFVKDGLFFYKRKWGAEMGKSGNESSEIYAFKNCTNNESIRSFLQNNPFIYLEKNKFKIDIFEKNK